MSSITNFEPFRHQSNPCFGRGIESIFELPLNICSNLSTFAFYIGPQLTAGNMTLRIFLKATLIKGSITTNNIGRPGMEGGEAWAGVRSLGRVKDLEQEL
jgi:hypothetical protein